MSFPVTAFQRGQGQYKHLGNYSWIHWLPTCMSTACMHALQCTLRVSYVLTHDLAKMVDVGFSSFHAAVAPQPNLACSRARIAAAHWQWHADLASMIACRATSRRFFASAACAIAWRGAQCTPQHTKHKQVNEKHGVPQELVTVIIVVVVKLMRRKVPSIGIKHHTKAVKGSTVQRCESG